MSEDTIGNTEQETPDELTILKERADQMGLQYHPKIGLDNMRKKIQDHLAKTSANEGITQAPVEVEKELPQVKNLSKAQLRAEKFKEANKLVRIEVTCMDPNKKAYQGDLICVSNGVIGTIKKFVPFGVAYHVQTAIYNVMKEKKCQTFEVKIDGRGNKTKTSKMIPTYAIKELPPLTPAELTELARRQAMNGSIDS